MPPPDPNDIRVLIPRVRRAIDGPTASSSAAVSASLNDDQVKDVIADAIADVIFYAGGLFGHKLHVAARDDAYNAPVEWTVDPPLEVEEETVVVATAALGYFFHDFRDRKVQETIRNEGQEWTYALSANLLTEQLKGLREARDEALERLESKMGVRTSFYSFLQERDALVAWSIEPYTIGAGHFPTGQEIAAFGGSRY